MYFATIKKSTFSLYSAVNFFFAVLLPGYSLLIGDSTIFYLIYLYWWQELLASAIEGIYYAKNREAYPEISTNPFWARLFLLFVYFVFIIIFFGLVSDWGNDQRIKKNLEIFFFRDIFFMINLVGLVLNDWLHKKTAAQKLIISNDPFKGRMMVMHISIILGGSTLFIGNTAWAGFPFLLIKAYLDYKQNKMNIQEGSN
ncbi:DUF6498-containing protein [Sediminibacterium salmoneum]|uniref:DUF6498-containing protein n=1 Tax=Sediminibacterium salmoneum TaxID=426421 RepID=UPI000479115E|nr:DUF6498-containing protein [Sediminibacterium salmoneum]